MKITMFELLGLVKDGKAPKRIRVRSAGGVYDKEFYFDGDIYKYKDEYEEYAMTDDISIEMSLNDEVEIIEEEKEIPEKLGYCKENTFMEQKENTYLSSKERILLDSNFKELGNKINEIIDYLKSKGE